ncbi:MAG: tetratricopeptide repeat protein [Burkholderiaceae bacterium]
MHDARGNLVSTASAQALAHHEYASWQLVAFYGDPLATLDAAIAADPGWALARVAKAALLLSLTEPNVVARARDILAEAQPLLKDANARERAHHAAALLCAQGLWREACDAWDAILLDHPRDILALMNAHLFDFYRGDARNLRARIARVLPQWDAAVPLYAYVLGMYAFGLEESNLYPQAEEAGRASLALDARGPWAIHAVAHAFEMQGRHAQGRAWLEERRPDWTIDNGLSVHLWWHLGLFQLETLATGEAVALYDAQLGTDASTINLQWLDAAALLWRIELLDVDVGRRWAALAARWADPIGHAGFYAFNDVHAALALIGSGDFARAQALLDRALPAQGDNRAMASEVGVPLLQAMLDHAQGRHDAAATALYGLRARAHRFGGSHAQRDLIDQTALAACALGSRKDLGRALLNERCLAKPPTPLTAHWASQLGLVLPGPN